MKGLWTILVNMAIGKSRFGKMFLNIFIRLFLLGLCLGEKKETRSSISFHHDNVPLPYKYNAGQDYSIEKTYNDKIDYFRYLPNIEKSIQFAPLNPEKNTFPDQTDIYNPTSRTNLEPKFIAKSADNDQHTRANYLQYIQGHNIVVPIKIHKDIGLDQDIITENTKEMDQKGYENSQLELKQEKSEPQKDVVTLKVISKASTHIDFNNQQTSSTQKYPTKSYHVLSAIEKTQIEPLFNTYVKVPRLHLNIARAYNFARFPLKASVMGYDKFISNSPKRSFVPNIDVLLQGKTFLYPVNNNRYTLRT